MKMEKENQLSIVYFDCSHCVNGMFFKIDTSERRSLPQMLTDLTSTSRREPNTHTFFVDILHCYKEVKHVDDFYTIVLEAPENR